MYRFVILTLLLIQHCFSSTYDLIDATPRCWKTGYCPHYGEWGTYESIHPNSEERALRTLINIARMHPEEYHNSSYGKYYYGTFGPSWTYNENGYCAQPAPYPYYWMSDANQAARFAKWDCTHCNSSCGHDTCSNPNRCSWFGDNCNFGVRCDAFVNQNGSWCAAEGICGANLCFASGHCSAFFKPTSWVFGVGFAPYANGYVTAYVDPGYVIDYKIANAAHFDERIKIKSDDYNKDSKYLTFLLQWFNKENIFAEKVYVIYKNTKTLMPLTFGNETNGFYLINMEIPTHCQPYYFLVESSDNEIYRMPENERYMFGTAWTNWSWWQADGQSGRPNRCEENHYYLLEDETNEGYYVWVPNGGPKVPIYDDSGCVGCSNTYDLMQYWDAYLDYPYTYEVSTIETTAGSGSTGSGGTDTNTDTGNSGTGGGSDSGTGNSGIYSTTGDNTNNNNNNNNNNGNVSVTEIKINSNNDSSNNGDSASSVVGATIAWTLVILIIGIIAGVLIGRFYYLHKSGKWDNKNQSFCPSFITNIFNKNNTELTAKDIIDNGNQTNNNDNGERKQSAAATYLSVLYGNQTNTNNNNSSHATQGLPKIVAMPETPQSTTKLPQYNKYQSSSNNNNNSTHILYQNRPQPPRRTPSPRPKGVPPPRPPSSSNSQAATLAVHANSMTSNNNNTNKTPPPVPSHLKAKVFSATQNNQTYAKPTAAKWGQKKSNNNASAASSSARVSDLVSRFETK